jgi:MFS family permease
MATDQKILTPTFGLLSAATFFFFLSQSALFPVLPLHLHFLGAGPSAVGLVVGIMLGPAVILRPLVGRHIDRRGRRTFLITGFVVSAVACAGYAAFTNIAVIFAFRLLHGVAMASFYPSASTMTGDIAPVGRRAEALSYFSMFLFAGIALGPALGETLYRSRGAAAAFGAAAALAVAGLILAVQLRESAPQRDPVGPKPPLLHRAALFPAAVLGLVAMASGGLHAFIPLYVVAEGANGAGDSRWFFGVYAVTIMVLRIFVGRVADRYGRGVVVVPGTLLCGAASFLVAASASQAALIGAALLFGLGWGAMFPGLFALIMDRVEARERGSAMGTFTAAFDVAFGGGQILLGVILEAFGFTTIFVLGGVSAISSAAVFLALRSRSDARFPATAAA